LSMKGARKNPLEEATLVKDVSEIEKSNKVLRSLDAYPLLEIQSGPKIGTWFTLTHQKEISLGRANVNSIVLEDNSVSRSHSVIHELDEKYFVKDIGSRNGTFVNDKKIQDDFLLKHGDRIKIGIYVLKFLTQPEEEAAVEEEVEEPTVMDEAFPPAVPKAEALDFEEKTRREKLTEASAVASAAPSRATSGPEAAPVSAQAGAMTGPVPAVSKGSRSFKNLVYFLVALILVGGVGYTAYRFYIKKRVSVVQKPTKPAAPVLPQPEPVAPAPTPPAEPPPAAVAPTEPPAPTPQVPPTEPSAPPTVSPAPAPTAQVPAVPTQGVPLPPAPQGSVPIFLDVDAQPLAARIFYQNRELGKTPFKTNLQVPINIPQEVTAVYHFDEINTDFSEKKSFTVSKQDDLINVRFEGTVGSLRIKSLPKNVQVYLEGTFASNQLKSQAAKISDIVYTRPIPLPFGSYTIELKRPETLEGSTTVVDSVKYSRQFVISKESPVQDIALADKDLTVFPAKIKTTPSGALVLVDGKKYGETPFEGELPQGKHQLTLKKEGFYEHEQPLALGMNTPFAVDVSLKTSEAGQFINKGRDLIKQGQYPQAIEQLAESLTHNPSPAEVGQVQIALGNAYIKTGAYDVAIGYFEKAKLNPNYKSLGDLGIAEAAFAAGNRDLALARLIDVMINEKDEKIKSDAETIFHKVSPVKSVVLVSTDPPGAKVSINGQDIAQPTPLVLSDLNLGSYRLSIDKDGFKHFESRFQLMVSTFKPVAVKLEPLQ